MHGSCQPLGQISPLSHVAAQDRYAVAVTNHRGSCYERDLASGLPDERSHTCFDQCLACV